MFENAFMWNKGFEAGIAFALRHNCTDIYHFITELSNLRTWKTHEEWKDFIERNVVEEENG